MFSDCDIQVSLMGCYVLDWYNGRVGCGGRGCRSDVSKFPLNFQWTFHYLVHITLD